MWQWLIERGNNGFEALAGLLIGLLRAALCVGSNWRHDGDLVLDDVEDQHGGRTHEHTVRDIQRVRRHIGQLFDQPHRVVAHVAENAR